MGVAELTLFSTAMAIFLLINNVIESAADKRSADQAAARSTESLAASLAREKVSAAADKRFTDSVNR